MSNKINLTRFKRELVRVAKTLPEKEIKPFQIKVAFECLRRVMLKNPVGNPALWRANQGKIRNEPGWVGKGYVGGRSRGNWQIGIGSKVETEIDRIDPSGNETLAAGLAELQRVAPFQTIHLTNNVPYILDLEDGWSTQAPQGMLGVTLAEIEEVFR